MKRHEFVAREVVNERECVEMACDLCIGPQLRVKMKSLFMSMIANHPVTGGSC